jgi:predicted house-cleaning NTP pyrophosphatase (Maf/HAM1 superfamily)
LGKPDDPDEATAMLRSLRNRCHEVLSAVFALNPATGQEATALSRSLVWMRGYSDDEIAAYVASGDPMDKAGAYAIQNRDFAPVARMEGCFSGVMGFPMGHVARVLTAVGLPPATDAGTACQPFAGHCCQL